MFTEEKGSRNNTESLVERAKAKRCRGDLSGALEGLTKIFREQNPTFSLMRALIDRGDTYQQMGAFELAKADYDIAASFADSSGAWHDYLVDRIDETRKKIYELHQGCPNTTISGVLEAGQAFLSQRKYNQALIYLSRAAGLAFSASDETIRYLAFRDRGNTYRALKAYHAAAADYRLAGGAESYRQLESIREEIERSTPPRGLTQEALRNKGESFRTAASPQYGLALGYLTASICQSSEFFPALRELGNLYSDIGDIEMASV